MLTIEEPLNILKITNTNTKMGSNWRCCRRPSLFKWDGAGEWQGDKQGRPSLAWVKVTAMPAWPITSFPEQFNCGLSYPAPASFFVVSFRFLFVYGASSCFLTVEHCILSWLFFFVFIFNFTDHIYFTIFVEDRESVWLYFCILEAFLAFVPQLCVLLPMAMTVEENKQTN